MLSEEAGSELFFLDAAAASSLRNGHLAVPNGALYQSCHGHDDRPFGDRT